MNTNIYKRMDNIEFYGTYLFGRMKIMTTKRVTINRKQHKEIIANKLLKKLDFHGFTDGGCPTISKVNFHM